MAQAINGISFDMPHVSLETNIIGTLNLMEAIRLNAIKPRVLMAGSSTEYGNTANIIQAKLDEEAALRPISPYGISKVAMENIANLYFHSHGIPTIKARLLFIHIGVGGTFQR